MGSPAINVPQVFAVAYNIDVDIADGAIPLDGAVIGLDAADVQAANKVLIATEGQACRVSLLADEAATADNGVKYAAGSYIEITGSQNIQGLTLIALADNLVLQIALSK